MPQLLTDAREPINVLYYGDGGSGKTTDIASLANKGRTIIVDAESGVKRRPLVERQVEVANIEVFPGPGEELTFDGLEELWRRSREELNSDPDSIIGFGWDSVTEIHKALLGDVVEGAVAKAARAGRERDRFFIDRADYGTMTEQVRNLVRKFRDLPCHFAVSALTRREQDDDGGVAYQPAVTPALQNDLIGWMDMVCVTSTRQVAEVDEYWGLFRPHGKFRGKDRLSATPRLMIDPTMDRLIDLVEGNLDLATDEATLAAEKRQEEVAEQAA